MGIHLSRHVASFIKKEGGCKTTTNKQKRNLTSPIIKFQINSIISRENLFRKKVEGLLPNLLPIYTWCYVYVSDYKSSNTTHQWRPKLHWLSLHSTFVELFRCPIQLHVYFVIVSFSTGEGRIKDFFYMENERKPKCLNSKKIVFIIIVVCIILKDGVRGIRRHYICTELRISNYKM